MEKYHKIQILAMKVFIIYIIQIMIVFICAMVRIFL